MLHRLAVFTILALSLVIPLANVSGQDKTKGQLPQGWKALMLTADQKSKVYAIQGDYRKKVADLEKQIISLKAEERTKLVEVLTDAQKATLRKILGVPDDSKKIEDTKKP